MKKYIFLICLLFCISCSNSNANNNLEVQSTSIPASAPEIFGPVGPDQDRIDYAQSIINRASELTQELNVAEVTSVTDFLQLCSIWAPVDQGMINIFSVGEDVCQIVVLKDEDRNLQSFEGYFNQSGVRSESIGVYDYQNDVIIIRMLPDSPENKLSLDFLALVMVHEAIHKLVRPDCTGLTQFACRASREAIAYQVEFLLLDLLGNNKAPDYFPTLQATAQKMGPLYEESGEVFFPDYEKSSDLRRFFDSESKLQDDLWLSVYWLRGYWEMYMFLRGDMPSADISFQAFLQHLYESGVMK
jgi:hypothetical protein